MIYSKEDILKIEMSDELKKWAKSYIGRAVNKSSEWFNCENDEAVIAKLTARKAEKEAEKAKKAQKKVKTETVQSDDAVEKRSRRDKARDKFFSDMASMQMSSDDVQIACYEKAAHKNRERYKQYKLSADNNKVAELSAQSKALDDAIKALQESIRERVETLTAQRDALAQQIIDAYKTEQKIDEDWQAIIRYISADLRQQLETETAEFDAELEAEKQKIRLFD